jgi:hypothetical protein
LVIATLAGSVALAALALASTSAAAIALLVFVGVARTPQTVAAQTLLQRSAPLDVLVHGFCCSR